MLIKFKNIIYIFVVLAASLLFAKESFAEEESPDYFKYIKTMKMIMESEDNPTVVMDFPWSGSVIGNVQVEPKHIVTTSKPGQGSGTAYYEDKANNQIYLRIIESDHTKISYTILSKDYILDLRRLLNASGTSFLVEIYNSPNDEKPVFFMDCSKSPKENAIIMAQSQGEDPALLNKVEFDEYGANIELPEGIEESEHLEELDEDSEYKYVKE